MPPSTARDRDGTSQGWTAGEGGGLRLSTAQYSYELTRHKHCVCQRPATPRHATPRRGLEPLVASFSHPHIRDLNSPPSARDTDTDTQIAGRPGGAQNHLASRCPLEAAHAGRIATTTSTIDSDGPPADTYCTDPSPKLVWSNNPSVPWLHKGGREGGVAAWPQVRDGMQTRPDCLSMQGHLRVCRATPPFPNLHVMSTLYS